MQKNKEDNSKQTKEGITFGPEVLSILQFFSENNIQYQFHRIYDWIVNSETTEANREEKELAKSNIWDYLNVKYAFGYSKPLTTFTLHFLKFFKDFSVQSALHSSQSADRFLQQEINQLLNTNTVPAQITYQPPTFDSNFNTREVTLK